VWTHDWSLSYVGGNRISCKAANVLPTVAALVDRADDKLFDSILHNPHHVLDNLMPDETVCSYEL